MKVRVGGCAGGGGGGGRDNAVGGCWGGLIPGIGGGPRLDRLSTAAEVPVGENSSDASVDVRGGLLGTEGGGGDDIGTGGASLLGGCRESEIA